MSEDTLSGRWQIVSSPPAMPGKCGICGRAEHEEGFIDGRLDFEFYGTLYFCMTCASEIGRVAGCLDVEQSLNLKTDNEALINRVVILQEQVASLEGLRGAINSYNLSTGITEPSAPEPYVPPDAPADVDFDALISGGESGEVEVTESSDEPGPNDSSDYQLTFGQ